MVFVMEYIFYFFILTATLPLTLAGRVIRVGNPIVASNRSVNAKAIFLFGDAVPADGILFAYSAYFCSDKLATFQVWRPMLPEPWKQNQTLTLIHQQAVRAIWPGSAEDNYLSECVLVKKGDRLGVFLNESPGAIAYSFSTDASEALAHQVTTSHTPEEFGLGQSATFDSLPFPYLFSAAAFIDTKLNKSLYYPPFPSCPQNVMIPPAGGDTRSTTVTTETASSTAVVEQTTVADSGHRSIQINIGVTLMIGCTVFWMS